MVIIRTKWRQPSRQYAVRGPAAALSLLSSRTATLVRATAGEAPIPGADSHHLAEAIKASGRSEPVVVDVDQVPDAVRSLVEPGDVVVTMGAGSIGRAAPKLAGRL